MSLISSAPSSASGEREISHLNIISLLLLDLPKIIFKVCTAIILISNTINTSTSLLRWIIGERHFSFFPSFFERREESLYASVPRHYYYYRRRSRLMERTFLYVYERAKSLKALTMLLMMMKRNRFLPCSHSSLILWTAGRPESRPASSI